MHSTRRIVSVIGLLILGAASAPAQAALQTRTVEYRDGQTVLQGYLAYDDAVTGARPGVLVVHEWKGLGDYAKHRAEQLAGLGYIAFAADMYGRGVYAATHEEAAQLSGALRRDRALMRRRVQAGLAVLAAQPQIDPQRLAAIGYCFGGTSVLELARSGAAVHGVVSFHGVLDAPQPAQPGQVQARVLVLTGADDPHVPPAQVAAFEEEMRAAGADYRVVSYPGAVHSFTVPEAGNDPSTGIAYNAAADRQSWTELRRFFAQLFQ